LISALAHDRTKSGGLLRAFALQTDVTSRHDLRARAAIVALHLGEPAMFQDLARPGADPAPRAVLIDLFPRWHGDLLELSSIADGMRDDDAHATISLGVGSIPANE